MVGQKEQVIGYRLEVLVATFYNLVPSTYNLRVAGGIL